MGFFIIVLILPSGKIVSVLNGSFRLACRFDDDSTEITSVQWLVNGAPLENLNLNATAEFTTELGGVGSLGFRNNLQRDLNNSIFKCKVITSTSGILTSSDSAKLILQG